MKSMRFLCLFLFGVGSIITTGCDKDRISRLEKENRELKAKLEKSAVAQDYDLQARCSKDAERWFDEHFPAERETRSVTFTNHYGKAMNTCFVQVDNNFDGKSRLVTYYTVGSLWNIYENRELADYQLVHMNDLSDRLVKCTTTEKTCSTVEEFDSFVQRYMKN